MSNFLNKNLIVPAVGLLLPLAAGAAGDDISVHVSEVNLKDVLDRIANYFLGAVVIASVFMIVWSAFNFVTANGDDAKLAQARKSLTFAIIGLIIAIMAMAIVNLVIGVVQ